MQAEALEIVVRSGEPTDLELATIAGAGVHLPDMQRAAEAAVHLDTEPGPDGLERWIASGRLGDDSRPKPHAQLTNHLALTALQLPNPRRAVK